MGEASHSKNVFPRDQTFLLVQFIQTYFYLRENSDLTFPSALTLPVLLLLLVVLKLNPQLDVSGTAAIGPSCLIHIPVISQFVVNKPWPGSALCSDHKYLAFGAVFALNETMACDKITSSSKSDLVAGSLRLCCPHNCGSHLDLVDFCRLFSTGLMFEFVDGPA